MLEIRKWEDQEFKVIIGLGYLDCLRNKQKPKIKQGQRYGKGGEREGESDDERLCRSHDVVG